MPGFDRIDLLREGETAEDKSLQLLDDLLNKRISVADLMGPIGGLPDLSPNASIPPGNKSEPLSAHTADFLPQDDAFNSELVSQIHPTDYVNPTPSDDYDMVVIGAGAAGLISSIMGHWLGKRVALIERHSMGGDCLNTGCVPSKAVIACAKQFHHTKNDLAKFGITINGDVSIDFGFVMQRMREIRAKISHHDSVSRYGREFCEHVYVGNAVFGPREDKTIIVTGDDGSVRTLKYKKAMIATGASASVPDILKTVPHLTNGNFFNLQALPPRMVVIGCGPIGMELAQSMRRFGSEVICLEYGAKLLPREDQQAVEILRQQLEKDGKSFTAWRKKFPYCFFSFR